MIRHLRLRLISTFVIACVLGFTGAAHADFPKPSPYQITWQLKFDHSLPKRIVVKIPGEDVPAAFWYMTYTVTNPITNDSQKDAERPFYPVFEMVTNDGNVIRSDNNIPLAVFDAIKGREGNKFLVNVNKLPTQIKLGEDQAIDCVAVWPEPMLRMGRFSVFVTGLSGETASVKGPDGKPIVLRKTLQLNFHINGDEVYPGEDAVNEDDPAWVMR